MSDINQSSTVEEIAALVSQALERKNISAVLSGGAVVSIYSQNEYESKDLDFISMENIKKIEKVIGELGFVRENGRHFSHPSSDYFIEFPAGPLAIGNEIISNWERRKTEKGTIQILTPTQCVMDRLAAYFHWNDLQSLDQALLVAKHQFDFVSLEKVKSWAKAEGHESQYQIFVSKLRKVERS